MASKSQLPKGQDGVLSSLNTAIDGLNLAKETTSITPVKAAFASASVLLVMIRDSMINKAEYVEIALAYAHACKTLNQGMGERRADQLGQSVLRAVEQLTMAIAEIQRHVIKQGKRNAISRRYHASDDKEVIAAWRSDLNGILRIFNAEPEIDTHATISDTHQAVVNKHAVVSDLLNSEVIVPDDRNDVSEVRSNTENTRSLVYRELKSWKADDQNQAAHASAPGESPLPVPRNPRGTAFDKSRNIVSEVHRDLVTTQTMVSDLHRSMLKGQEGAGGEPQSIRSSAAGELPPPPPRIFFGRDELIEKIAHLAEHLAPIALIGAGGIGKTSVVLTILHDGRIKLRFGDSRRFIRCDQFPASRTHFLRRLSEVIGAGIENPEDLAPLRQYLSSKEMLIVLDNAESVLDPQGSGAQEIYAIVDELARFRNICLCITSRISITPPACETLEIPTLSMDAGHDTFYRIYKHSKQSDAIDDTLEQLDFHPLSITLLATVAQHNKWDAGRLIREWERRRTGVLHAQHSGSLATTIELSLASPMFQELGPDARGLLGVIAFFPQGVNEQNIDWLFPSISGGQNMFDKFCILSLTYRSNGFVTMLAPLRDYLRPEDPTSSPLLCTTKEHYFTRLSAQIYPGRPGFEESRWITSEDVNVEHLLDVFTSVDTNSKNIWDACAGLMDHLYWHKPRLIILGPKIETLPNDHPSKAQCLKELSWLLNAVGNQVECKRILTQTLVLWRELGDDHQVAQTLGDLSDTNRLMGLFEEGIRQAEEASEIFERLGDRVEQAVCLMSLAGLMRRDNRLDAAEEAASRAINLLSESGHQRRVCQGHRVLGSVYLSKGDAEKAIHHFEVALEIASSFGWHDHSFWAHFALANLFSREGKLDDAHAHIERAKSHAANNTYIMARASLLQAWFWVKQRMFEEAKSEALRALDVFEKLEAANDAGAARRLLAQIDSLTVCIKGLRSDENTESE